MHDQIDQAYNADIIERGLKIGAEFDRQIDKAVKRLVMIKEFKRLYVPKTVGSKPVQIEAPPAKPIGGKTGIYWRLMPGHWWRRVAQASREQWRPNHAAIALAPRFSV